jgi:heat shock protein HslJ
MRVRRGLLLAVAGVVVVVTGAAVVAVVLSRARSDTTNGTVAVRSLKAIAGEYVSVNDTGAPAPLLDGLPVRLTVEKDRIRAYAGCNTMQGAARVEDGRLVVRDLQTTEIGCPPDVAAQERWVVEMLQAGPALERSGPYLSLSWAGHWLGLSSDLADRTAVSPSA